MSQSPALCHTCLVTLKFADVSVWDWRWKRETSPCSSPLHTTTQDQLQQGNPLQNTQGAKALPACLHVWDLTGYQPGKKSESSALLAAARSHETAGRENSRWVFLHLDAEHWKQSSAEHRHNSSKPTSCCTKAVLSAASEAQPQAFIKRAEQCF